jgi:chromosome partitioning protein
MPVVSVINMKGGVAKTTLATNLADVLARREDMRILLIDLDPQFNATQCLLSGDEYIKRREDGGDTIVSIFNDNPAPMISAVTGRATVPNKKLDGIAPWKIKENFDLLPGDLELYRLEMGGGQGASSA